MKAAIRTGWTGYNLSFTSKQPIPNADDLKSNQVLIDVKAAAINPVDYKLPRGALGPVFGIDFSGTIEAIGTLDSKKQPNIINLEVGDEVFGKCLGSLAEKCVTDMDELYKKPSFLTFEETAALPVAYLTGIQGLRAGGIEMSLSSESEVNAGKSVLIIGASGGCGIAGLQLLKGFNKKTNGSVSRVVGICSSKNTNFILENGATEAVDYTNKEDLEDFFSKNVGKFDCVYDCSTGSGGKDDAYYEISQSLLKKGSTDNVSEGLYVAINGKASTWMKGLVGLLPKNQKLVVTKKSQSDLQLICELLEAGDAKPIVQLKSFTKEGVEEGFELLKSRRTKGKIVFPVAV